MKAICFQFLFLSNSIAVDDIRCPCACVVWKDFVTLEPRKRDDGMRFLLQQDTLEGPLNWPLQSCQLRFGFVPSLQSILFLLLLQLP